MTKFDPLSPPTAQSRLDNMTAILAGLCGGGQFVSLSFLPRQENLEGLFATETADPDFRVRTLAQHRRYTGTALEVDLSNAAGLSPAAYAQIETLCAGLNLSALTQMKRQVLWLKDHMVRHSRNRHVLSQAVVHVGMGKTLHIEAADQLDPDLADQLDQKIHDFRGNDTQGQISFLYDEDGGATHAIHTMPCHLIFPGMIGFGQLHLFTLVDLGWRSSDFEAFSHATGGVSTADLEKLLLEGGAEASTHHRRIFYRLKKYIGFESELHLISMVRRTL